MYTPNLGFTARTRLEMIETIFHRWKEISGSQDSFAQFQGSNLHRLFHVFFDEIEDLEDKIITLQAKQFTYWSDHNTQINGSLGASYEGWIRVFSSMCSGLDIIGHTENSSLKPGEISIYFDNLFSSEDAIREAFLKCKNVAEPTVGGDQKIQVVYSNGQVRDYTYFNLLPENYTPIQVQIKVIYQKRSLQYKDSVFVNHFMSNFEASNRINHAFYPESYLDASPFPGVADFVVTTKLAQETTWVETVRQISLGNKFTLTSVVLAP